MAVRQRQAPRKLFVSFAGNGDVSEVNAEELLDELLPMGREIEVFFPENVGRGDKHLRAVRTLLKTTFGLTLEECEDHDLIARLKNLPGEDDDRYLVVLWDDEDSTARLVRDAAAEKIEVLDLTRALSPIELEEDEPEPEPEPRTRGRSRTTGEPAEDTVELAPAGPATPAPAAQQPAALPFLDALRALIREEVQNMGLSIGTNSFQKLNPPDEAVRDGGPVRAWVDADGEYTLAPTEARKAPRGKKTVELTRQEARDLGLV